MAYGLGSILHFLIEVLVQELYNGYSSCSEGTGKDTILLPTVLNNGKPITSSNKRNAATYSYFEKYVFNKGFGYDSDIDWYYSDATYKRWLDDTYGLTEYEQFMSSPIINPNASAIDNLQTILDLGGMVPVIGEPIDGVNAIIYFAKGDKINAALSSGSMIPFIGNGVTGAKIVKKGLNATDNIIDAVKGATKAESKILNLSNDITDWIGKDGRLIKNSSGDTVLISKNGTRRVRFDINNPSPHNNSHGHVEELVDGKWQKSGPIYPNDVPQN